MAGHVGAVNSVAFGAAPGGRLLLATGSEDRTVRIWDPLAGVPVCPPLTGHTAGVSSVAFGLGSDGRLLVISGSDDRTVRIWDPLAGEAVTEPLTGHGGWVTSVAVGATSEGALLVISGAGDKTVRVWEPVTGASMLTLRRTSIVRSLAAAGLTVAVGDDEGVCVIELDEEAVRQNAPSSPPEHLEPAPGAARRGRHGSRGWLRS